MAANSINAIIGLTLQTIIRQNCAAYNALFKAVKNSTPLSEQDIQALTPYGVVKNGEILASVREYFNGAAS